LISTPKISLLFGFRALYAFLFHPILNCWTASSERRYRERYTKPFLKDVRVIKK
jgi:hypothetical protein